MGDKQKICISKGCEHFIVPREEWGAVEASPKIENCCRYKRPLTRVYKSIVVHYSGFPLNWSPNRLQAYFQQTRKFHDFGVHFYIAGDGSIYEGRRLKYIGAQAGQSIEARVKHSQTMDPDFGSIGIDVAGCFDPTCLEQFTPTPEQKAALGALVLYLYKKFPRIKSDKVMGHTEVYEKIMKPAGMTPRRDSNNTVCPGVEVMKWVEGIRVNLPPR